MKLHSISCFVLTGDMLLKLHLQKTILYTLASLVLIESEEELTSTEDIIKLNYGKDFEVIYGELVR